MDFDELSDTDEYAQLPPGAATQTPHSSTSVQVDLAGRSHQGKVRPNYEDHFLILRLGRFHQTLSSNLPDGLVPRELTDTGYGLVVADGLGGKAAGEVTSRMAITLLIELTLETPD